MMNVASMNELRPLSAAEIELVGGGNPMAAAYAGASVGVAVVAAAFVVGAVVGYAGAAAYDALTDDDGETSEQPDPAGNNGGDGGNGEGARP